MSHLQSPISQPLAPRAIAEAALALLRRQQALDELSPAARAVEERALAKETATLETALSAQNTADVPTLAAGTRNPSTTEK